MTTLPYSLDRAFRKIVVATDFSDYATVAMLRAANLALEAHAEIILVHVLDPERYSGAMEGVPFVLHELEREAHAQLESSALALRDCGIKNTLIVREGLLRDCLFQIVHEHKADLLVLSTHGQHRFDREVAGSLAEKILRVMPCPVMTVGPSAWVTRDATFSTRRLLFSTDLTDASIRALPYADALARLMGAALVLLYVTEGPRTHAHIHQLEAVAKEHLHLAPVVDCLVEPGDLAHVIAATARKLNPEFILLGIHHEDLTHKPAGGLHVGLVYQIVSHTAAPVITIHDRVEVAQLRAAAAVSAAMVQ
jgi:nucleotide-binding universal stress UspA family protein